MSRDISESRETIAIITRQSVPRRYPYQIVCALCHSAYHAGRKSIFRSEYPDLADWLRKSEKREHRKGDEQI